MLWQQVQLCFQQRRWLVGLVPIVFRVGLFVAPNRPIVSQSRPHHQWLSLRCLCWPRLQWLRLPQRLRFWLSGLLPIGAWHRLTEFLTWHRHTVNSDCGCGRLVDWRASMLVRFVRCSSLLVGGDGQFQKYCLWPALCIVGQWRCCLVPLPQECGHGCFVWFAEQA